MLKLKRVEIQGFKSFFDRTEMKFNGSGIAAIVGPNGCGKSNLSDAMSWVLGEQSAKSLRGARMEDVIFAGTRDRKPLGLASVTMTLVDPTAEAGHHEHNGNGHTNGNGHAPHKPSEVTITRRLFRSGESEYLIDGKGARLRDIQDLFIGTGLGPESYAIIEQGRIGQILSNKPQDRRAIIEEAAGIGKFKTKKRLAEAKLEGAKQNLARVFDILEEVGRQVNSLKRQASKARRYEELKTEMIAHLRGSLTARFRMLERDAAKTALDLNLATAEFQNLSTQVSDREQEHAALQEACYRNDAELAEARRRLAEFELEQERTRGRLQSQAQQIGAMEQRLAQGETESLELEKRHQQLRQELEAHLQSVVELEAQIQSARERLSSKAAEREQIQQALQQRAKTLETGRQNVLRLLGESSALKNQLAQIAEYLSAVDRDAARCQRDEQSAGAELERHAVVKAELSRKMSAGQMELESTADKRRRVEDELAVRKTQAGEARKLLDQLRTDASRLKARKDSLEEILSHRAYT
ncbi:MAG: AAA family ATPase, partial [Bryobacteraceae bacterium]